MAGMKAAFDERLRAALPLGTTDIRLGEVLTANGFHRQDWTTRVDQEHSAYRREGDMVCSLDFWVHWSSNADGVVTAIRGDEIAFCL